MPHQRTDDQRLKLPGCNNLRSMCVDNNTKLRIAVRQTVQDFQNIAKSKITDAPDCEVVGGMADNQILQWDVTKGTDGAFTNIDVANANVFTSARSKEYIVASNGSDNNTGDTSFDPLLTFQAAVQKCGKIDAYDMVAIYVTGDVTWDPAAYNNTAMRLRESSFGGNLSRGLVLRGLRTGGIAGIAWPKNNAPRSLSSQLVQVNNVPTGTFIKDNSRSYNSTIRLDSTAPQDGTIEFYKTITDPSQYYPIVFDQSSNITPQQKSAHSVIYMSGTEDSELPSFDGTPAIDVQMNGVRFAGKVTLDNGPHPTTNTAFTMSGNIQIVELHFELQRGVVTPYTINGDFSILYSKFSATNSGLSTPLLELSTYGNGSDHLSTLEVTTSNPLPGGRPPQILRSIFEDIIIKFDGTLTAENSIFKNCTIINPQHVTCRGCTFYNCTIKVGDITYSHSFAGMIECDTCQFIYAPDEPIWDINNTSVLHLHKILVQAKPPGGGTRTKPLIVTNEDSTLLCDDIRVVPTTQNQTGLSIAEPSVLINAHTGKANIQNISVTSTSEYPLILIDDARCTLGTVNATTSQSALIRTLESAVELNTFDLDAATYTHSDGGVFEFYSSTIKVGGIFGFIMDGGVTTTQTIFKLVNSNFMNVPGVSGTGKFNIRNNGEKNIMEISGGNVLMGIGEDDPQLDLLGGIDIKDGYLLLESAVAHSPPFKLDFHNTTAKSVIRARNSKIIVTKVNIQNTTGEPLALQVLDNSQVSLNECNVVITGQDNSNCITVENLSTLNVTRSNITIVNAANKSSINIEGGSKFVYTRDGDPIGIIGANNAVHTLLVTDGSEAYLKGTDVSAANNSAIVATRNSKLTLNGGGVDIPEITASGTDGPDDAVVLVDKGSYAHVDEVKVISAGGGSAATGFKVSNNSQIVLNTVTGTSIKNTRGIHLLKNSKADITTVGSDLSDTGLRIGGFNKTWETLQIDDILPTAEEVAIAVIWKNYQGCMITNTP